MRTWLLLLLSVARCQGGDLPPTSARDLQRPSQPVGSACKSVLDCGTTQQCLSNTFCTETCSAEGGLCGIDGEGVCGSTLCWPLCDDEHPCVEGAACSAIGSTCFVGTPCDPAAFEQGCQGNSYTVCDDAHIVDTIACGEATCQPGRRCTCDRDAVCGSGRICVDGTCLACGPEVVEPRCCDESTIQYGACVDVPGITGYGFFDIVPYYLFCDGDTGDLLYYACEWKCGMVLGSSASACLCRTTADCAYHEYCTYDGVCLPIWFSDASGSGGGRR